MRSGTVRELAAEPPNDVLAAPNQLSRLYLLPNLPKEQRCLASF
jgi:hypothetical protein